MFQDIYYDKYFQNNKIKMMNIINFYKNMINFSKFKKEVIILNFLIKKIKNIIK